MVFVESSHVSQPRHRPSPYRATPPKRDHAIVNACNTCMIVHIHTCMHACMRTADQTLNKGTCSQQSASKEGGNGCPSVWACRRMRFLLVCASKAAGAVMQTVPLLAANGATVHVVATHTQQRVAGMRGAHLGARPAATTTSSAARTSMMCGSCPSSLLACFLSSLPQDQYGSCCAQHVGLRGVEQSRNLWTLTEVGDRCHTARAPSKGER